MPSISSPLQVQDGPTSQNSDESRLPDTAFAQSTAYCFLSSFDVLPLAALEQALLESGLTKITMKPEPRNLRIDVIWAGLTSADSTDASSARAPEVISGRFWLQFDRCPAPVQAVLQSALALNGGTNPLFSAPALLMHRPPDTDMAGESQHMHTQVLVTMSELMPADSFGMVLLPNDPALFLPSTQPSDARHNTQLVPSSETSQMSTFGKVMYACAWLVIALGIVRGILRLL